ncbi:MAG TPA: AMP-binding protein [Candidatus Cloacimonadota bacterium]|nr:AMP-binding protein [Candidatus Cloacimonadota bacterium]HPT71227.1 AMP-binding protein [Candidatus Cloacimonadota bacterium]
MQLHQEFIKTAKQFSNKLAVVDVVMNRELNFDKLLIASLILANRFRKFPETNIGIMVPTSIGCMAAVMGVLMCGKTPAMINFSTGAIDNSKYAQRKCNFKTIITSKALLDKLNLTPIPGMVFLEDIMSSVHTLEKLQAALKSKLPLPILQNLVHKGSRDEAAVILFTSGSEKDPKAVQLSHKNILQNISTFPQIFNLSHEDIILGNLPLFHVFGLTVTFFLPLILGGTVVAVANPLDYQLIVDSIRKYKATLVVATPTFLHGYLRRSRPGDFESVKYLMAGADKLTSQIRDEYLKMHNIEILEGYGATETSPVIAVNTPNAKRFGSVGKPIPGVQVRIVDRETDQILGPDQVGKVLVKGDNVMVGYYGDLEETSVRIRNGWYDTGDMGTLDSDGYLWHKGRLKRFVKIGGEMISLVYVESEMEKLLPEGTLCCVVEVPNPTKGADIVVALTTQEVVAKDIHKKLKKILPPIAMPKEFYVMDSLPLMGSGKVNFREVETICRELHDKSGKK